MGNSPGVLVSFYRTAAVIAGLLAALPRPAAAQEDAAEAQLRSVLRAFYFNLAHHDWEAIAADVLSAKVLASRPLPESLRIAPRDRAGTDRSPGLADETMVCSSNIFAIVDKAAIQRDGDWTAVSIPRCGVAMAEMDEFRLIYFEKRWRFVSIDLAEGSLIVLHKPLPRLQD
jgi:hypothetical protein